MRECEVAEARIVSWIGRHERAEVLRGLLVVLDGCQIVPAERAVLLAIVHAIDERQSRLPGGIGLGGVADSLCADGEARIRAAELRVELGRLPVVHHRLVVVSRERQILRGGVLAERL